MTPTDPELVQRLRSFVEWRDAHSISGPYQDLLTESLAALEAAEARVQQLEAALQELAHRWRAESEAIESEDDDASLKRFGTQMDPDGYILATVTLDTCAEELEKTVAVGRADTPEPPHED